MLEYFSHLILIKKVTKPRSTKVVRLLVSKLSQELSAMAAKFYFGSISSLNLGVRDDSKVLLGSVSLNLGVDNVTSNVYLEASLSI